MFGFWNKKFWVRKKKSFALIFFGTGLLLASAVLAFESFPSKKNNEVLVKEEKAIFPKRVIIERVGIDLPVFARKVIDDDWQLGDEGAYYLIGSGTLGKKGNVVIYGHNTDEILGPARWLKEGELIKVISREGRIYNYQISEIKRVSADDVSILDNFGDYRLTLYTCTGFLDKDRLVIIGKMRN